MNQRQGLASTAQKYLSTSLNPKSEFKCENCHLQFLSAIELINHTKKFCTNSGFDTLPGLNIKLKNPSHGATKNVSKRKFDDSLTNALEEIQKNKGFNPMEKQLKNDLMNFQRHQEDIKYVRPYGYQSRKNQQIYDSNTNPRQSRSLYMKGNEQNDQKNNYGQKIHNNNIHEYPAESNKSKAYSFTSSYLRKFKQSNTYISPPTQIPIKNNQKVKQYTLLDKSDISIQRMPEQQKRQYVIRKILQLEQIQEGYKINGGKNDQFVENTIKMKKFYQGLLEKINNNRDSMFGGKVSNMTRVSTPISKLRQSGILNQSLVRPEDGKASIIKSKISQIHQKTIAKRQDDMKRRFHTQIETDSKRKFNMNDILDDQMMKKLRQKTNENRQNPVIVIPIQQPTTNYPQQSYEAQITIKYMESLSALKDEQNKNFLQLIQRQNQEMKKMYETQLKSKQKQWNKNEKQIKTLQNKYQKLVDKIDRQKNNNQPIKMNDNNNITKDRNRRIKTQYSYNDINGDDKEYRDGHLQIDNLRMLNLQSEGYHGSEYEQLSNEEKILMQMQKEERDEMQLFAHLPKEIQQIKLKSIQEFGQKRFQMEKQVIKQKLQKLKLSQEIKSFELQRRLLSQEMQNEKKKIDIHKLMKKKIKQMVKDQFREKKQEYDDNEDMEQEQIENQGLSKGTAHDM